MSELYNSLGYKYLQQTKFDSQDIGKLSPLQIAPGLPFKEYPGQPRFALDPDFALPGKPLPEISWQRRSVRRYDHRGLALNQLSLLLWACAGVTARAGSYLLRTVPSAGALYPVETYVLVRDVQELEAGLYHLFVPEFCLEQLTTGDFSQQLAQAAMRQHFLAEAPVVFCWSAVLRRNMSKYGHRGLRYIFLDAGHVCQNLLLYAGYLGLGGCPVAAFFDAELNLLFDLDGQEESMIYCASVGWPAS